MYGWAVDTQAGDVSEQAGSSTPRTGGGLSYYLRTRLGAGRFGEVWVASRSLGPRRLAPVAIKLFAERRFEHIDPMQIERAADLDHTHLLRCRHSLVYKGRPGYAMDLADGGSAPTLLEAQPEGLPPIWVTRIVGAVAEALAYLHRLPEPLVHGDVHPGNVLLHQGVVKLADAGQTRAARGYEGPPEQALHLPTAAPEMWHRPPEPASDVYSLAATAYHLLTGTALHEGSPQAVMAQQQRGLPPLAEALPAPWPDLLGRCLNPQPEQRPSAAEVAHLLLYGLPLAGLAPHREPWVDWGQAVSGLTQEQPAMRRARLVNQRLPTPPEDVPPPEPTAKAERTEDRLTPIPRSMVVNQ